LFRAAVDFQKRKAEHQDPAITMLSSEMIDVAPEPEQGKK
jgi:hypothetical protein